MDHYRAFCVIVSFVIIPGSKASARSICFWKESKARTWPDSQTACMKVNGSMAKVTDSTENQRIAPLSLNSWIGLSLGNNTEYSWTDGTTLVDSSYMNWVPNEPNGTSGRHCVTYNDLRQWNLTLCEDKRTAFCEKQVPSNLVRNATVTVGLDIVSFVCNQGYSFCDGATIKSFTCSNKGSLAEMLGSFTECFPAAPSRNLCYWKESSTTNWAAAVTHCSQLGGRLAKIARSDENDQIASIRADSWIGLKGDGDQYTWQDGSRLCHFSPWAPSQPMATEPSCVRYDGSNSQWEDADCDSKHTFICEKEVPTSLVVNAVQTIGVNSVTISCRQGYSFCDGATVKTWSCSDQGSLPAMLGNFTQCFPESPARRVCFWRESTPTNWANAVSTCSELGGRLAKITRSSENELISSIRQSAWIGLSGAGEYRWADGTTLCPFNYWGPSEPSSDEASTSCVRYDGSYSQWEGADCNSNTSFICEKDVPNNLVHSAPYQTIGVNSVTITCRSGYRYCDFAWKKTFDCSNPGSLSSNLDTSNRCYRPARYRGVCFWRESFTANWADAATHCSQQGGRLAKIRRLSEHNQIANIRDNAWIGLKGNGDQWYTWEDGSRLCHYTYWAPSQPMATEPSCVRYDSNHSLWEDADCDSNVSFICEKYVPTTLVTKAALTIGTNLVTARCQQGYSFCDSSTVKFLNCSEPGSLLSMLGPYTRCYPAVSARSICFWRESEPASWSNAGTHCSQLGGRLAKIVRMEENDEIASIRSDAWIGLSGTSIYKWVDNSYLCHFTDWAPYEPSTNLTSCVKYEGSFSKWEDADCQQEHPYICEKSVPTDLVKNAAVTVESDAVTYTCNQGYLFCDGDTNKSVMCGTSGSLASMLGTFTECFSEIPTVNATVTRSAQSVTVTCNHGYSFCDGATSKDFPCSEGSSWQDTMGSFTACVPQKGSWRVPKLLASMPGELTDSDLTTCLPLTRRAADSPLDMVYQLPWAAPPCPQQVVIGVTFSTSLLEYDHSVLLLVTDDHSTSATRLFDYCDLDKVTAVTQEIQTREFQCVCVGDCYIVLRIGFPIVDLYAENQFYLCEVFVK